MNLTNPEQRRGLRSVVQALIALAVIVLAWWLSERLASEDGVREALRWLFGIAGLGTFFYGLENTTRAFKLSAGRDGIRMESGAVSEAAQEVADAAQDEADAIAAGPRMGGD